MGTEAENMAAGIPTFEETVLKAAKAIYANTTSGQTVPWDLLPRNVQEELQTVARIAITVALQDLYVSIGGTRKVSGE